MNYVPTKKGLPYKDTYSNNVFFLSREHTGVCVMVGQTVVSSMQLIKTYGPKHISSISQQIGVAIHGPCMPTMLTSASDGKV